jgi:shikimate dehydrogenase
MTRATRFVGILGWPLDHTLSPAIHNAAFRRLGLDWVYLSFPVPAERLAEAVAGLRALGAQGANVTMPHKEAVVDHLDELSGEAEVLGAVNTIQQLGGKLIGHNTDIGGFIEFVRSDAGFDPSGKTALVLGSGGAARAVVKGLSDAGAERVTVAARSSERARGVAGMGRATDTLEWEEALRGAADVDLVVNATPLGMHGENPLPGVDFRSGQAVVDLVYEPPTTPLVQAARSRGADAWGGLGMLVQQAVAAFRIWTGREPPVEAMSAAAIHKLAGPLGT